MVHQFAVELGQCLCGNDIRHPLEGELRKPALAGNSNVSSEDTLRHMLCQKDLLMTQVKLFTLRGENHLVQEGASRLRELHTYMDPLLKAWEDKGYPELDYWEDSEENPENDPELRKWAERAAR